MVDTILIISGFLLIFTGIVGAFIPVLPGPPLSYAGMIVIHLSDKVSFSSHTLIILGFLALVITLIDYIMPVLGTKTTGGSKHGIFGASIGLFIGIFIFPPFGIIAGPLLGAFIAEIMNGQASDVAMKSAIGSFIGLLFGVIIKLIISSIIAWFAVKAIFL